MLQSFFSPKITVRPIRAGELAVFHHTCHIRKKEWDQEESGSIARARARARAREREPEIDRQRERERERESDRDRQRGDDGGKVEGKEGERVETEKGRCDRDREWKEREKDENDSAPIWQRYPELGFQYFDLYHPDDKKERERKRKRQSLEERKRQSLEERKRNT